MSWLKNVATFGGYDKLKEELKEFKILSVEYKSLENDYLNLNKTRLKAYNYLSIERENVKKNLSLAKNVIARIKTPVNDKKLELKSDFITYYENNSAEFTLGNVSVDFKGKLDSVSVVFLTSLDTSFKNLGNRKEFTKNDLKLEAATIVVDVLISSIEQIINLNKEVNSKRKELTKARKQMQESTKVIAIKGPELYAETRRILEITKVLNKHNQVFSNKYETIQKEITKKSKLLLFWDELLDKKLVPDESMQQHIYSLRMYSSQYNKFNNDANI